jgi:hypothetical protein
MCNITKKTDKKTVTVYKAVIKDGENYYAFFSGIKIGVGTVKPQIDADYVKNIYLYRGYFKHDSIYNENMVGKTSGFAKHKTAKLLLSECFYTEAVILKMVLGGEIWEGNAEHIACEINPSEVVYAGTEILSFEEVK